MRESLVFNPSAEAPDALLAVDTWFNLRCEQQQQKPNTNEWS